MNGILSMFWQRLQREFWVAAGLVFSGSVCVIQGATSVDEVFQAANPGRNSGLRMSLLHFNPTVRYLYTFTPDAGSEWYDFPAKVSGTRFRVMSLRCLVTGRGDFMLHVMAFDDPDGAGRFAASDGPTQGRVDRTRLVGDRFALWLHSFSSTWRGPDRDRMLDLVEKAMLQAMGKDQPERTPHDVASGTEPVPGQTPAVEVSIPPASEEGRVSGEFTSETVMPAPLAVTALESLAVGGVTALSAWLMMFGMGVTPREVFDGVRELFGAGSAPVPPPPPPPVPVTHQDGEVNDSGEVWSAEDRGWVGRDLYEQEKGRRVWIDDKNDAALHAGQSEDVRKAYDQWQDSREKLEAVREEGRMLIKKENLRQWVADRERELQEQSYWTDVKNNFLVNVDQELTNLPHETFELCRETAKAVKSGVDAVADVVKDATNWEILRATGAQTAKDLIGSPIQSALKVNKFYHEVARGAGKIAVGVVAHPIETIKAVSGYENWSKALDSKIPLSKRIGYALMGTVDTVSLAGGFAVKESGAVLTEGLEAVDKLGDVAKAEAAAKAEAMAAARQEAWELGEQQARTKVASLQASKSPEELRAAVLEIQGDKRGLQMLNREADELKATFNQEIRGIYKETDAAVESRLRDGLAKKGVDLDRYELKASHATNPSKDPFKIGADRDITYSLYDKETKQWVRDVPARDVQKVYDDEFFQAAHGRPPANPQEAADFARKMDQQCVDAVHAEAYGRGPKDLNTALHEPGKAFSDPTQVGKAVSFKSHEWYARAEEAARAGNAMEAEKFMSEGFRQTTKQFDNILVQRHEALRQAGAEGLKGIPERLEKAVDALRGVKEGVSPVAIEQQLRELGYRSPGEVASHMGEYVEAMDKLRPAGSLR